MPNGGDGKFDTNDAIEFYGYPLDTLSTGARTYWLRAGKGNASRAATSSTTGGDPLTSSVPFTYERIMRGIFAAIVNNDDADAFFGSLITIDPVNEPLTVANLDTSYAGDATLEIVIQGGTDMQHRIDIAFNGHSLGTVTLWRVEQPTFTFTIPQSWLTSGTNNVTLTSLNGYDDVSVIATTRLTYRHLLRADNGARGGSRMQSGTQASAYPVQFSVEYPDRDLDRVMTAFRLVWAIPIVILVATIQGGPAAWETHGQGRSVALSGTALLFVPPLLMIVFRQKYPRWWFDWNLELMRFANRVCVYVGLVDDRYPSTDEQQSVLLELP